MSLIRQQRVAEQIQTILAELVRRHLRDPRLQLLTITDVKVDQEFQTAHVYVNALGDESRHDEVLKALVKAGSFLRRELAHQLHTRTVPQLFFHWDPTQAHADQVYALLAGLEIPPAEPDEEE